MPSSTTASSPSSSPASGASCAAHYRPVDSGGVSWGYLHGRAAAGRVTPQQRAVLARGLPWSSTDVATALGVHRQNLHEALPDAEFVRDVHDLVTGWAHSA